MNEAASEVREARAHVDLSALPPGHPMRACPMRELRVECRNRHAGTWREVSKWAIGAVPYDSLGSCWLDNNEFRAPAAALDARASGGQA